MKRKSCEIVILGAGFAGSLQAIIARKLGRDVLLLERGRHPRFAIGESSTPLANFKLAQLADTYDLSWLKPLTKYGPWKRTYPEVTCGLKRGFSFFSHRPEKPFQPSETHETELLVAANPDAERGDTHWFRQEFDAFLVHQAVASGVQYVDQCNVASIEHDGQWRLSATADDGPLQVDASFVIDATGGAGPLAAALGLKDETDALRTSSRAVFGHFENVACWSQLLDECGARTQDHSFPCDSGALHHIIEGGWMWVLRFDNGITSAGFSLDPRRYPVDGSRSGEDEWTTLVGRYPSIQSQFVGARLVGPMVRTGRIQRKLSTAAGMAWAALPHSAAFIDPWLSPGIAHSLFGVERLSCILGEAWSSPDRADRLSRYSRSTLRELEIIDTITAACFARFDCFPVLVALTMLYFAAVTFAETRYRTAGTNSSDEFLLAHDKRFTSVVHELTGTALRIKPADAEAFARRVAEKIAPYNLVGLCNSARHNMYWFNS